MQDRKVPGYQRCVTVARFCCVVISRMGSGAGRGAISLPVRIRAHKSPGPKKLSALQVTLAKSPLEPGISVSFAETN